MMHLLPLTYKPFFPNYPINSKELSQQDHELPKLGMKYILRERLRVREIPFLIRAAVKILLLEFFFHKLNNTVNE